MPTRLAGAGARVIGDDEGMPTYRNATQIAAIAAKWA